MEKIDLFVLINLEGLAAKLRRRRANHGFGTVRILNRVMIELIRLQPTDDHTGHKNDQKTGADQIASIDQSCDDAD